MPIVRWLGKAVRGIVFAIGIVGLLAITASAQSTFSSGSTGADGALVFYTPPPRRSRAAMAYDAARQRMVLFGLPNPGISNETWEYDGTTWTQNTVIPPQPRRVSNTIVYDAARQRVVLFGGNPGGNRLNDTWEYDGTAWTQRTPAISPPGRSESAMAYDSTHQVTVLFSGSSLNNDTWLWDGTTWSAPALTQPAPVFNMSVRPDGIWHYTTIDIPAGVTVTFKPNAANAPVVWLATGPDAPPTLLIQPFHQAGAVVSLRQFTNNAYNHHHGIQATERFGIDTDPDGDGVLNEMTRADVTASVLFQATLAVPGRVIPNDPEIEEAVLRGETLFADIGCTTCHVPTLPLDQQGWVYTEPNPFNPPGNLQVGETETYRVNLTSHMLPQPRLQPQQGVVQVPAYTDLKLHDITSGADDPNREPLDMHEPAGSAEFFAGNARFLTRKLWGMANEPPFFHHGQFTTIRESVEAHAGAALASRQTYEALSHAEQDAMIEFLKTLQVLPPGTPDLIVDEKGRKKDWPPHDKRGSHSRSSGDRYRVGPVLPRL